MSCKIFAERKFLKKERRAKNREKTIWQIRRGWEKDRKRVRKRKKKTKNKESKSNCTEGSAEEKNK